MSPTNLDLMPLFYLHPWCACASVCACACVCTLCLVLCNFTYSPLTGKIAKSPLMVISLLWLFHVDFNEGLLQMETCSCPPWSAELSFSAALEVGTGRCGVTLPIMAQLGWQEPGPGHIPLPSPSIITITIIIIIIKTVTHVYFKKADRTEGDTMESTRRLSFSHPSPRAHLSSAVSL